MFAPNQSLAARELLRVCKPGGRIGLCTWMPEEFGGPGLSYDEGGAGEGECFRASDAIGTLCQLPVAEGGAALE